LWTALALVVDVVRFAARRRPFMSVRTLAFACLYFWGEVVGLLRLLLAGNDVARNYAVQAWWTGLLFRAVRRLFALTFVVDGDACVGPGTVVLVRHSSIIDALLPAWFITRAHGVRLRYVVKRELLADPCMDIAGNRLPHHFVARTGDDTAADVAAIEALARGAHVDEATLVYPEGTRFTPAKRDRAITALAARDPALAERARALTSTMPPKLAGAFALLDGAPAADAIFMAHTGLEGFAHVDDIWSGALLGRTVRISLWRVPRERIPTESHARALWLYDEWAQVDALAG
ncbi:MAG TPA: 1-acyl-sn-glycerol-3-phosphate acyltransferase, partial [Myxococcota bacterium]